MKCALLALRYAEAMATPKMASTSKGATAVQHARRRPLGSLAVEGERHAGAANLSTSAWRASASPTTADLHRAIGALDDEALAFDPHVARRAPLLGELAQPGVRDRRSRPLPGRVSDRNATSTMSRRAAPPAERHRFSA